MCLPRSPHTGCVIKLLVYVMTWRFHSTLWYATVNHNHKWEYKTLTGTSGSYCFPVSLCTVSRWFSLLSHPRTCMFTWCFIGSKDQYDSGKKPPFCAACELGGCVLLGMCRKLFTNCIPSFELCRKGWKQYIYGKGTAGEDEGYWNIWGRLQSARRPSQKWSIQDRPLLLISHCFYVSSKIH